MLFSFLGFTYYSYQSLYKKDIDIQVENEILLHKKEILSSIVNAAKKLQTQKEYFISIHLETLNILKEDPSLNLYILKAKLEKRYLPSYKSIEVYLINKDYIIYESTFKKDIGLNLSMIEDGKVFLDKTTIDGKIYMADYPSTDSLDLKYKYYSISKLNDTTYLELGFIDDTLNNLIEYFISNNKTNKTKIALYIVTKDDKNYQYYAMEKIENEKSKREHFESARRVQIDEVTDDDVINSIKLDKPIHSVDGNIHTAYVKLFNESINKTLGMSNIVMKIDIDVSEKKEFMQSYKYIFIISLLIVSILLFILFKLIQKKFTNPIEEILKSLESSKKVDTKFIFSLNNELSAISSKYNTLFDVLSLEIDKNKHLLDENKQFIADTVHQIRTPLTNIMLNGDMIKLYKKDEELSKFINQINASINMLNNSYEDLSYFITYNSMEYNSYELSISEILKERVKFFETISQVNKKEIVLQIDEDIEFTMNQIELERLIDNNLSNGVRYASIGTSITVSLIKNRDTAVLEFKTFGEAIKDTARLFEKNYREDSAKRGLGIGLYMVKNICEKYNISYDVSYEDGQNIFTYSFRLK